MRVEGDAVTGLQSAFIQNWIETSGEILNGPEYFPFTVSNGHSVSLVVPSAGSAGRSTRARILFQSLIAAAHKTIYISTPYFLPDKSARQELVRAIQRGVQVKIIVPGKHSDHPFLLRSASRLRYGDLLKAGAEIYEYEPTLIHAKVMIIDGLWSVVGSANFDNRSFGLNDEVNLAARDADLAARLTRDFEEDIRQSERVQYDKWKRRGPIERFGELLGWLLERQQ